MTITPVPASVHTAAISAALTPEQLHAALHPLLPQGRWDVRCNSWGLVLYPAVQTKPKALT